MCFGGGARRAGDAFRRSGGPMGATLFAPAPALLMIKKSLRLPLGKERMKNGETATSSFFLLKFRQNAFPHHRFGAIVSVKAGKTSVARHAIRRTVLDTAARWPARAGMWYDFLLIASPRLATIPKNRLRDAVREDIMMLGENLISRTHDHVL